MKVIAQYESICPLCELKILPGDKIQHRRGAPAVHDCCDDLPKHRRNKKIFGAFAPRQTEWKP